METSIASSPSSVSLTLRFVLVSGGVGNSVRTQGLGSSPGFGLGRHSYMSITLPLSATSLGVMSIAPMWG